MRYGVFGTGVVGTTLAGKLLASGNEVMLGSRTADNEAASGWAAATGGSHGTFADAAEFGETLVNATAGAGSLAAIGTTRAEDRRGKVLIDVSNPLDFSSGFPPTLFIVNDDSLAERIQVSFPELRVVKTLNTMNAHLMVEPSILPEPTTVFVAGNDEEAKQEVRDLLKSFGWLDRFILDLGDITASRGTEMALPLWLRITGSMDSAIFNFHIVRPA